MDKKQLYNNKSEESVKDRKVFGGNPTCIFDLHKVKYTWADSLWRVMLANTWFPHEVPMAADKNDYERLSYELRSAFDRSLAQLIFLDSIQTNNLIDNLNAYITAPELNLLIVRQAYEEAIHSKSYAIIVDSLTSHPETIYDLHRILPPLDSKNQAIAKTYMEFIEFPCEKNLFLVLVANLILEGIHFYSAFAFFYALYRQGTMLSTGRMIRFIHRDENTHLVLFERLIKESAQERPYLLDNAMRDKIDELFICGVHVEMQWARFILHEGITLLNCDELCEYIKYLCDKRRKAINLMPLYNIPSHPMEWVETFGNFNDQRTNFFEGSVTNYSKSMLSFDNF